MSRVEMNYALVLFPVGLISVYNRNVGGGKATESC